MQKDLISKKDVINLLCNLHIDNIAVNDKKVTEYIRELPCAYNVEKVAEQLEELPNYYCEGHWGEFIDKERAIEIVRNGGKEGE